jgi:hypothetical protein
MIILHPKEVAAKLKKSLPWVYAHAPELGAVKIGGSWIFTQEGVEDAILRFQAEAMESCGKAQGQTLYPQVQKKARGFGVGSQYESQAEKSTKRLARKHGLDDLLW